VAPLPSGTLASLTDFRVEPEFPLLSWTEAAQARKSGRLAFSQIEDDFVDHSIQLVRSFRFGQMRLLRQTGRKLRFVHSDSTLASEGTTLLRVVLFVVFANRFVFSSLAY
jgi:hypothetical protein